MTPFQRIFDVFTRRSGPKQKNRSDSLTESIRLQERRKMEDDTNKIVALRKMGRFVVVEQSHDYSPEFIPYYTDPVCFHIGDFVTLDEANECLKSQPQHNNSEYVVMQPE
jgi:hypothetical protein